VPGVNVVRTVVVIRAGVKVVVMRAGVRVVVIRGAVTVLVIRAEVSVDVVRATVNVDVTRAGTNVLVVVSVLTRLIIDVDVNDRNTVVAGMVVVLRIVVVTGKGLSWLR
jgi:hypothetical protein